jgi:hypothetical protein
VCVYPLFVRVGTGCLISKLGFDSGTTGGAVVYRTRSWVLKPMPDQLHLDKVRAGSLVWNAWRRDNPGIVPDLNDLRIPASELQFGLVQGGPVDLSGAELRRAKLAHATLIEANLTGAVLAKADLSDSRLSKADLRGADLRGAALAHADLSEARLDGAFVSGVDLRHARGLTQQQIDRTNGGFMRWRSIQSRHRSATRAVDSASMSTLSLRRPSTAIVYWRFVKAVLPLCLRLAWNGSATVSDGVAALSRATFVRMIV